MGHEASETAYVVLVMAQMAVSKDGRTALHVHRAGNGW